MRSSTFSRPTEIRIVPEVIPAALRASVNFYAFNSSVEIIPIHQKFTLTPKEASVYFHIGEKNTGDGSRTTGCIIRSI